MQNIDAETSWKAATLMIKFHRTELDEEYVKAM
jgi:hypothetical protein